MAVADALANEINGKSRDKDSERARQARDAETRGDEVEEDEEMLYAAAPAAAPAPAPASNSNKERQPQPQRETRAPDVPLPLGVSRWAVAREENRSSGGVGGGGGRRAMGAGEAGGARRNTREHRAVPRDRDRFDRQHSNDASQNSDWRARPEQQRGPPQLDANANSHFTSAQPNSLLGSQQPGVFRARSVPPPAPPPVSRLLPQGVCHSRLKTRLTSSYSHHRARSNISRPVTRTWPTWTCTFRPPAEARLRGRSKTRRSPTALQ